MFIGLFVNIFFILTIFSDKKKHIIDPKFTPKISILIPAWNEGSNNGERLTKTIDSVLNADYPKDKLEIIVINDGSTDDTLKIAESYLLKGVKVFSNKKSMGKVIALNKGLKHSTGQFVASLDADSFIYSTY